MQLLIYSLLIGALCTVKMDITEKASDFFRLLRISKGAVGNPRHQVWQTCRGICDLPRTPVEVLVAGGQAFQMA